LFYSNRTVINNLIKFRLIFIQTKRVSYTQRHSHESLPPRPRSEYKEKKKLIFFYTLPSRRISFNPISCPGSFCDGRVSAFFLFHFRTLPLSPSRISANTHAYIHSSLCISLSTGFHFSSSYANSYLFLFAAIAYYSLARSSSSQHSHSHTHTNALTRMRTCVASYK